MRRQVVDGLIIATVVLGATHLYALGVARKVVRPDPAAATTAVVTSQADRPLAAAVAAAGGISPALDRRPESAHTACDPGASRKHARESGCVSDRRRERGVRP